MKNILLKFINNHTKCHHKNALLYQDEGYCPDCGQYLVKNYYIIRCARCDVKREAKLFWGEIVPQEKFCTNCGARDYYIEKLEKVNFVDARYAIYLKEVVSDLANLHPDTQIWVDDRDNILKQITWNKILFN